MLHIWVAKKNISDTSISKIVHDRVPSPNQSKRKSLNEVNES